MPETRPELVWKEEEQEPEVDSSLPDIEGVLDGVQKFLCVLSNEPLKDAGKITALVEEIIAPLTVKSLKARTEPSQMLTEEDMQKDATAVTAERKRSPELDKLLADVIDDPEVWLSTPTIQFGGRRPADLIGTEEESKIFDILHAVEQGLF
jgi:hypothetical protein